MEGARERTDKTTRVRWLALSFAAAWTAALAILLVWELADERTHAREVARGMAEAAFVGIFRSTTLITGRLPAAAFFRVFFFFFVEVFLGSVFFTAFFGAALRLAVFFFAAVPAMMWVSRYVF